jgi:hypothetical protein
MRIEQSQVALASRRVASISDVTRSSTQAWIGDRPARAGSTGPTSTTTPGHGTDADAVAQMSAQALSALHDLSHFALPLDIQEAQSDRSPDSHESFDSTDPTITDPKLSALIMLIERLTGHKIHLARPGAIRGDAEAAAQQAGEQAAASSSHGAAAQPQPVGWGVEVQTEQIHQETESTDFSATGQVVLTDGRTISFDYQLGMHREFSQRVTSDLQFGDAVRKVDPIALNLSGGPVSLRSDRSGFDINSDGTAEQVALAADGTYFLAIDRNGNGTIDNGSELFGPATGNGFAELKSLDGDGNGWIDEGDAAYGALKLWSGAAGGLQSLDAAGVGALYVGKSASTQFDIRNAANETLGQVVSSSVYLGENGRPGAMAQVDLTA